MPAETTQTTYRCMTDTELVAAYEANEERANGAAPYDAFKHGGAGLEEYLRRRGLIVRELNRRRLQPWLR